MLRRIIAVCVLMLVTACSSIEEAPLTSQTNETAQAEYYIGPGDVLQVFVWRNEELSTTLPVRPDGRISLPLIEDLQAVNKTPTQLARDVEAELEKYIQSPVVTVIVTRFVGPFSQQIRVVGEAAEPNRIAYRQHMTVLDVMIEVGGLTRFAAGNDAVIVRRDADGNEAKYNVRLDDLIRDGDVSANAAIMPGDILIIPQSWF